MNSEQTSLAWGLAVLLCGGAALGGLEHAPRVETARSAPPLARLFALGGTGAALAADACWLRANLAWEQGDETAVRRWIEATTAAAPDVAYFRVNAARMLAFDLPAWRIAGERTAPAAVQTKWRAEAAEEAIRWLALGPAEDATLAIESGNIALYGLRDRARAAGFYRRAAELPGAPWHAGRIYAQLLRELGRDREALEWLREWLPRLPADDPAAQRALVLERIAALELELRSRGEPL